LAALIGCRGAELRERPVTTATPDAGLGKAESASATARAPSLGDLRAGDILFQSTRSAQSRAIELATHSTLSHVGVVLPHDGRLAVYEAVGPVKFTDIDAWVMRGEGGHVLAKRFKSALSNESIAALSRTAETLQGRPYDFAFDWSDERLYCSELVYKVYQRSLGIELGTPRKLREYDLTSPEVRAKLRERYGTAVPLDEPMIAPSGIAESPLLGTVFEM
jgi:hypothetical protein